MEADTTLFQLKQLIQLILNEIEMNMKEECLKRTVSPTQFRIIDYILEHDNNVLQKELETALGISRATVSDVLKTMEKYDLIERISSDVDTRTNKIILKESALQRLEEGKKIISKISGKLYNDITGDELITFQNILNKMIKNLENKK